MPGFAKGTICPDDPNIHCDWVRIDAGLRGEVARLSFPYPAERGYQLCATPLVYVVLGASTNSHPCGSAHLGFPNPLFLCDLRAVSGAYSCLCSVVVTTYSRAKSNRFGLTRSDDIFYRFLARGLYTTQSA